MIDQLRKDGAGKRLLAVCFVAILPVHVAAAQQLGQGTDAAELTIWQFAGALIFIAILVIGASLVVRYRGGSLPFLEKACGKRVRILEVNRIAPQTQICLLQFEGREYLIAFTTHGANVIETRPAKSKETGA